MHRRLFALLCAIVLLSTGLAFAEEPAYDGAHFKRVTLVVSDLERSLKIYRDILGFQLDGIMDSSEASYSYPVFKIDPEATLRFATLSAGPEQVRTMALTESTRTATSSVAGRSRLFHWRTWGIVASVAPTMRRSIVRGA